MKSNQTISEDEVGEIIGFVTYGRTIVFFSTAGVYHSGVK